MALTANEISEIRLLAGDNCADSADYVVTDAQLDLWFAELGGKPCVVTRVIQARIADASKTVDIRQDGSPAPNPLVAQLQTLLDYWQGQCVETIPAAGLSELSLGIDEETTRYTNP
jgi:hypothetical protein